MAVLLFRKFEKYHLSDKQLHNLVDMLSEFLKEKCPTNTKAEINEILNVHLLYYCRKGIINDLSAGLKHPSFILVIKKKLESLEKEKEAIKK